ncbi:gamma-glutamyltranspeptidase / glutathione hydrolase / leukotriene-C4 hydrolase [Nematocida sp. AWRm80]|nr:gamma-glutamyltranspeptidase / glutathione hydrolase / leukotriene-C4 hydrolase [Nematocida sp. AWRm80]
MRRILFFIMLWVVELEPTRYVYAQKRYTEHCVTSDLDTASEIGSAIISQGGNALDGAIATAIALGGINAFASGIGGGGFLLLYQPETNESKEFFTGYNFREKASSCVDPLWYRRSKDSSLGRKSIAIPGEVSGLFKAHQKYGCLPWKDLFTPTIDLMENGFCVPPVLQDKLEQFKDTILNDHGLKEIYTRNNKLVKIGDVITRVNYANTLKILAEDPLSFYLGDISTRLIEFINEGEHKIVSPLDFQSYSAQEITPLKYVINRKKTTDTLLSTEEPILEKNYIDDANILQSDSISLNSTFQSYVLSLGIPTCGYMLGLSLMALEAVKEKLLSLKEEQLQRVLMVLYRKLYQIRGLLEDRLDENENKKLVTKSILLNTVFSDLHNALEKELNTFTTHSPNTSLAQELEMPVCVLKDHGTTHINAIDKNGMMVSLTTTINNYWGSGLMDPVTGIILNNQLDDFAFSRYKNLSGIILTAPFRNNISKNKQPLSSAMPSILQYNGSKYIIGGSGGIRIPTAVISILTRALYNEYSLQEAVDASRLHTIGDDIIQVENAYPIEHPFINNYKNSNYVIKVDKEHTITSCSHIIQVSSTGIAPILAVLDHRKLGASCGV